MLRVSQSVNPKILFVLLTLEKEGGLTLNPLVMKIIQLCNKPVISHFTTEHYVHLLKSV